jgi:hypothetical protein
MLLIARPLMLLLLCCGLLFSCSNEPARSNKNTAAEGDWNAPQEITYENIQPQEAIEFVELWSKIYSTNTFSSYIPLYNQHSFKGIKRTYTGETNTYNYAGWIKNKKDEFSKFKPSVSVENIRVTSSNRNGKTIVQFTQYWYSTTGKSAYADMGVKTMTLVKIEGKVMIEHEELLYSEPIDGY